MYFKFNFKINFNNKTINKNIIIVSFLFKFIFFKKRSHKNFKNLYTFLSFLKCKYKNNLKLNNNLKFLPSKNKILFFNNLKSNTIYKFNIYKFNNFYKINFNNNMKTKSILNFYNNHSFKFFYKNTLLFKFNILIFFYFFNTLEINHFYNFFPKNKYNCFLKNNYNFFLKKLVNFLKLKINNNKNKFYYFFLNSCFEYLFKNKFFIKISNESFLNVRKTNMYSFFKNTRKLKKYFLRNFKGLDFNYFIKILMVSLIKKDLNFLSKWLNINIEILNLKMHKKFLTFLKNLFLENEEKIITNLNINGFFLDIRGKVGVAGNSKKRHFYFYIGNLKYSSKNSKMDLTQNIIKTYTGCLGLTMILSY